MLLLMLLVFVMHASCSGLVEDHGNLMIKLYADWHSRLICYYFFEQFVRKAEKVGASNRLRMEPHRKTRFSTKLVLEDIDPPLMESNGVDPMQEGFALEKL